MVASKDDHRVVNNGRTVTSNAIWAIVRHNLSPAVWLRTVYVQLVKEFGCLQYATAPHKYTLNSLLNEFYLSLQILVD